MRSFNRQQIDPHLAGRRAQIAHLRAQQRRGLIPLHADLDRAYWRAYRLANGTAR